jgi:hypothetical protein
MRIIKGEPFLNPAYSGKIISSKKGIEAIDKMKISKIDRGPFFHFILQLFGFE